MDPMQEETIELLEPSFKTKMHLMLKELQGQLTLCSEAARAWEKTGEEAEREIQEHFAKCLRALAERKAGLMKEVAYKVNSESM